MVAHGSILGDRTESHQQQVFSAQFNGRGGGLRLVFTALVHVRQGGRYFLFTHVVDVEGDVCNGDVLKVDAFTTQPSF